MSIPPFAHWVVPPAQIPGIPVSQACAAARAVEAAHVEDEVVEVTVVTVAGRLFAVLPVQPRQLAVQVGWSSNAM